MPTIAPCELQRNLTSTELEPTAFPVPPAATSRGVTQRDWFAAAAMQGVVTKGLEVIGDRVVSEKDRYLLMARRAYAIADAMLQARSETSSDSK